MPLSSFIFGRVASSHRRYSKKKRVLKSFAKFTGKHLCQNHNFNKVAGLRPATLLKKKKTQAQVFSCEFFKISKNTYFEEHLNDSFWLQAGEPCRN